jgi:hypothetical protein
MSDTGTDQDQSWDDRRLCPDDACIGVIGADGRCSECGKVDTSAPVRTDAERLVAVLDDGDGTDGDEPVAAAAAGDADDAFDDDRELCADDACIGVIGANGRCNECGKPRA